MRAFLLILCCIISSLGYAQKLKLKKIEKDNETYQVLKSDPSIRHGYYKKYSEKTLLQEGFYKDGLKDSIWKTYDYSGAVVEQGSYSYGRRVGIWEFSYKGELIQKYDYSNRTLLYVAKRSEIYPDTATVLIETDSGQVRVKLQRMPVYLGGMQSLNKQLANAIDYPREARDNGIEGKVLISFVVDSSGNASNFTVLKSAGKELDNAALKAVKSIEHNWLPAMAEGQNINFVYRLPITFQLER